MNKKKRGSLSLLLGLQTMLTCPSFLKLLVTA